MLDLPSSESSPGDPLRRLAAAIAETQTAGSFDEFRAHLAPEVACWVPGSEWHSGRDAASAAVADLVRRAGETLRTDALIAGVDIAIVELSALRDDRRGAVPVTEVLRVERDQVVELRVYVDPLELAAAN